MRVYARIEMISCVVQDQFDNFGALDKFVKRNHARIKQVTARTIATDEIKQGRKMYLDEKGVIRCDSA